MNVKRLKTIFSVLALSLALCASAAAQAGTTKVQGKVTDQAGQPIVGADVQMIHNETGRKFNIKTDKKGQYFVMSVPSGTYKLILTKDGKPLWTLDNLRVSLTPEDLVTFNIDLAKEVKAAATEGQAKMTEEQKKELERLSKENLKIDDLNKMLKQGKDAIDAGNFDEAITIYTQTTKIDPTLDLLWARLGDAYIQAAKKDTDSASKKQKYVEAVTAMKKAVELATAVAPAGAPAKKPKPPQALAAYYNNLGEALGRSGEANAAVEAYDKAATTDPTNAGTFYFNMGATLTNTNRTDEAIKAYDKCIAADPARADCHYYKGIAMLGKATMKGNTMIAPDGTAEEFNKYLELAPDGALAEQSKQMLQAMGEKIETSYGKGRKSSAKSPTKK